VKTKHLAVIGTSTGTGGENPVKLCYDRDTILELPRNEQARAQRVCWCCPRLCCLCPFHCSYHHCSNLVTHVLSSPLTIATHLVLPALLRAQEEDYVEIDTNSREQQSTRNRAMTLHYCCLGARSEPNFLPSTGKNVSSWRKQLYPNIIIYMSIISWYHRLTCVWILSVPT
jgi:hypothetical protein